MPSVVGSGTQLTTAAEVTIVAVASNVAAIFNFDLDNLAAGDVVRVRGYKKVLAGGSENCFFDETFSGVDGGGTDPVKQSVPFTSPHSCHFTIIQTAGTFRNVPWSFDSL